MVATSMNSEGASSGWIVKTERVVCRRPLRIHRGCHHPLPVHLQRGGQPEEHEVHHGDPNKHKGDQPDQQPHLLPRGVHHQPHPQQCPQAHTSLRHIFHPSPREHLGNHSSTPQYRRL